MACSNLKYFFDSKWISGGRLCEGGGRVVSPGGREAGWARLVVPLALPPSSPGGAANGAYLLCNVMTMSLQS